MKSIFSKRYLTLGALVLGLGVSATAMTGCRSHSPEARAEKVTKRIASYLDLDEGQKSKLNAIRAGPDHSAKSARSSRGSKGLGR